MNIVALLKQEEERLTHQLSGIQTAIAALNGSHSRFGHTVAAPNVSQKRRMSAAARAKISRAAKARWARFRAQKARAK